MLPEPSATIKLRKNHKNMLRVFFQYSNIVDRRTMALPTTAREAIKLISNLFLTGN
jgi:hypothetical protein